MTAVQLLRLFDFFYATSIVGWLGAILFFSFGVAPIIFAVLDAESAAKFVRRLFPRYYLWIAIASVISLASFTSRPLVYPELRAWGNLIVQGLLLAVILISLYSGNSLTPAINNARDAGEPQKARFDALHKRSVRLNVAMLAIGIYCVFAFETRSAPQTAGIVELSVEDKAEYERRLRETLNELLEAKAKRAAQRRGAEPVPTP